LAPALAVLADTDNDIEAVVAGVQTLAVALRTIANEGEGVVFKVVLELGERPVSPLVDDLLGSGKVEGLDTTRPLVPILKRALIEGETGRTLTAERADFAAAAWAKRE
jgi:hypothetical protein